jgi:hypothetical protein
MGIEFFKTAAHFRAWLQTSHSTEAELALGFCEKNSGRPSITYSEAVDEALCFGWIDGVRHSIDAETYRVRFTPRKPRSQWSAVNMRRVHQLIEQGKMAPEGLAAFAGAETQTRTYSCEVRYGWRTPLSREQISLGVLSDATAVVPPDRDVLGRQRQKTGNAGETAQPVDWGLGPEKSNQPAGKEAAILPVIGFS